MQELGKPESLITYVTDRPGHDRRYGIDPAKITRELGWKPKHHFETGIQETIQWERREERKSIKKMVEGMKVFYDSEDNSVHNKKGIILMGGVGAENWAHTFNSALQGLLEK